MTPTSFAVGGRPRHKRLSGHPTAFIWLHLRARGIPLAILGVVALVLLAWVVADWLADNPLTGGPGARAPVVMMAPLLGAVLVSSGLGGADEEMERTTPARWRLFRTVHVVAALVVVGSALALIGLWEPRVHGAFELVRNTLGFVGMIAVSAVFVGSRLAWVFAVLYGPTVYLAVPPPPDPDTAWWTWPVQPWSSGAATLAAVAVFAAGLALYIVAGSRSSRTDVDR